MKEELSGVVRAAKRLAEEGLVSGTWGNLSIRLGKGSIAITPRGRALEKLRTEDLVLVDLRGGWRGSTAPSTELRLHLEIYRAREDVNAVIHIHSPFACAAAVAGMRIPPVLEELAQLVGGSVEVAEYAPPGTEELARNAVRALGSKNAVLLSNHGAVCTGRSLGEALLTCEVVERGAKVFAFAKLLGQPRVLDEDEVQLLSRMYRRYSMESERDI